MYVLYELICMWHCYERYIFNAAKNNVHFSRMTHSGLHSLLFINNKLCHSLIIEQTFHNFKTEKLKNLCILYVAMYVALLSSMQQRIMNIFLE
jgi:hypothetical protein